MKNCWQFIAMAWFITSCVSMIDNPPELGVDAEGQFKPCPDKPNCISSQAQSEDQFLTPIAVPYEGLFEKIKSRCDKEFSVTWTDSKPQYLRGVFVTTIMRYPDDVEFYYDKDKSLLHFRSASRFGYSDMGKNKSRMLLIEELIKEP